MRSARIDGLRGHSDSALARLREAVDACPDALVPLVALIDAHRRYVLPDDERQVLLRRLDQRLADAERPLASAEIGVLATQPGIGEDVLRRILPQLAERLAAKPDPDPGLLAALARLEERLGNLAAAAATLERLWNVQPRDEIVWRLVGLYRSLRSPAEEARWLGVLVARMPEWRASYIRALSRAGKMDELRRQIDALAAETIARPVVAGGAAVAFSRILSGAAWNLYDQGLDAQAEGLFLEALGQTPQDESLRNVLLNLYGTEEDRRRHAEARARQWQEVSDPQSLFDEGTQLLTAGDAEAAIALLRRAAQDLPELEPAWYNLGMAAYRLEDWETVVSAFGRPGELNPGRGPAFFFRGIALVHLERWSDAVNDLRRALELEPDRVLAHYYLSVCHAAVGDEEAAGAEMKLYEARAEP